MIGTQKTFQDKSKLNYKQVMKILRLCRRVVGSSSDRFQALLPNCCTFLRTTKPCKEFRNLNSLQDELKPKNYAARLKLIQHLIENDYYSKQLIAAVFADLVNVPDLENVPNAAYKQLKLKLTLDEVNELAESPNFRSLLPRKFVQMEAIVFEK
mmetsp:Transcript_31734/g.54839  ORF Transcript_31734/g.54839 Transcript_31734/m.54839 type:complete len:154 (+) Transcript_31734:165-626(+)